MKKTIAFLACACAVFAFFYYHQEKKREQEEDTFNFSTWKLFTPASKLFQVLLPSQPQYGKDFVALPEKGKQIRYDVYAAEKVDGTLFLIHVVTYPSDYSFSSPKDLMQQTIENLMQNRGNSPLNNLVEGFLNERSTLDFGFENQNLKVEGKSIHEGKSVYLLTYIAQKDVFDEDEYRHFISSFKILALNEQPKKLPTP